MCKGDGKFPRLKSNIQVLFKKCTRDEVCVNREDVGVIAWRRQVCSARCAGLPALARQGARCRRRPALRSSALSPGRKIRCACEPGDGIASLGVSSAGAMQEIGKAQRHRIHPHETDRCQTCAQAPGKGGRQTLRRRAWPCLPGRRSRRSSSSAPEARGPGLLHRAHRKSGRARGFRAARRRARPPPQTHRRCWANPEGWPARHSFR